MCRLPPRSPLPYTLFPYTTLFPSGDPKSLLTEIGAIPGFLAQGKVNLKDANARDLWVYSVASLGGQLRALQQLQAGTLTVSTLEGRWNASLDGASPALTTAVASAIAATQDFSEIGRAECGGRVCQYG